MIGIVGGTGFIGQNILEELGGKETIRALYRKGSKIDKLKKFPNLELVEGDLEDPASLNRLLKGVDKLVYAGAVTANLKNKNNLYYRVNVEGTKNLIKAAQDQGVKKILLLSGLGTKPDKPGTYMQTRWEMEQAVRTSGIVTKYCHQR